MDEYLQHMKTLRSQMNDVEDQATKISVEEQMRVTTIQSMENDLVSAKSEAKRLKEAAEEMAKEKGKVCAQILDKQRRIASLESDSSTLTQTLELIRQEKVSLSSKLMEKRTYYAKVQEDIIAKLQEQEVKDKIDEQMAETEGNEARKTLTTKLESAKAKLDEIAQMKLKLVTEKSKINQSIEKVKSRANKFKSELFAMDIKTLEEEQNALLSDKAGETEYWQSLHNQIEFLKGISCVIKCDCGQDYKVELSL